MHEKKLTCHVCCLCHLPLWQWHCGPWRGQSFDHTCGNQEWPSQPKHQTAPAQQRSSQSSNTKDGGKKKKSYYFIIYRLHENLKPSFKLTKSQVIICVTVANNNVNLTVVVFWMISGSSLSSGTTSSTKRGTVGGAGGGARGVMAAFLALEKNLLSTEDK